MEIYSEYDGHIVKGIKRNKKYDMDIQDIKSRKIDTISNTHVKVEMIWIFKMNKLQWIQI